MSPLPAPRLKPGSQTSLRNANQRRVLDSVRRHGQLTQAQISRRTALAPSTVSNIVHELIAAGLLVMETDNAGRRGQLVSFSGSAGHVAGVDVGHRHVTVAVADLNQRILAQRRHDLPRGTASPRTSSSSGGPWTGCSTGAGRGAPDCWPQG